MALTIRLTPGDEELVNKLKKQLGSRSLSQALLQAADLVVNKLPVLEGENRKLKAVKHSLKQDINNIKETLLDKKAAEDEIEEFLQSKH